MINASNNEVQFDGNCAFALSTGKKGVPGLAKHAVVRDGKVYYFSNPVAKLLFLILPGRRAKAEQVWLS